MAHEVARGEAPFDTNLELWEKDRGRVHPYRGRLF
jgi:hypothetical protein